MKQKLSFIAAALIISVYFEFSGLIETSSPLFLKDETPDTTTAFNILDPSDISSKDHLKDDPLEERIDPNPF